MRGKIFLLFPHHFFWFSWPTCEGAITTAERRSTWNGYEIPVRQGTQGRVKSLHLLIRGSGPGLCAKIRKSIQTNRPRKKIHRHFKIHPLKTAPFSPYNEGGDVYGCFRLGSQPPDHKNRRKLYEIQIFLWPQTQTDRQRHRLFLSWRLQVPSPPGPWKIGYKRIFPLATSIFIFPGV